MDYCDRSGGTMGDAAEIMEVLREGVGVQGLVKIKELEE